MLESGLRWHYIDKPSDMKSNLIVYHTGVITLFRNDFLAYQSVGGCVQSM